MSAIFTLTSDDQFIRAKEGSQELSVYTFLADLQDFGLIFRRSKQHTRLSPSTRVGPTASKFKELEVLGVTIGGDRMKQLIDDLVLPGESHYLMVNRRGLCLLHAGGPSIAWLRINDRFGWSKYGVKVSVGAGLVWSVWEMNSGAVLVAPLSGGGEGGGGGGDGWEKAAEEKEKVLREKLEEKEKEVGALKAALNALTIN